MIRIIPAIDIIEGKCIRLIQGDYERKIIYNENPLEVAKQFEDNGIQYLHLVDLDGAKAKKIINRKVLEDIAAKTNHDNKNLNRASNKILFENLKISDLDTVDKLKPIVLQLAKALKELM